MKTFLPTTQTVERKWYVVDAEGQTLGRLAANVAAVLRGKHKPIYTPSVDTGDYVVIINAEKIKVTGGKEFKKEYTHHSGYVGGLKTISFADMLKKHPERILEKAIKGMLPHNKLGRAMYKKLRVVVGPEHNHQAQMPEELKF